MQTYLQEHITLIHNLVVHGKSIMESYDIMANNNNLNINGIFTSRTSLFISIR